VNSENIGSGGRWTTRRRWVLPLAVALLLVVGGGIAFAVNSGHSTKTPSQSTTANKLANVDNACKSWLTNSSAETTSEATWCNEMVAWMNQELGSGRSVGRMMWGSPDQLSATCRSWISSTNSSHPSLVWCGDMVTWMSQHMNGSWNNWMDNGSMMGN
jgi:hypothetical protein